MTPEPLDLAPFSAEHLDEAAGLVVEVFAREPWNEEWPRQGAQRRLRDILHSPGSLGVCALRGGELVGFALGRLEAYRDEEHFYLQEMCVSADVQRRGVGTRILTHLHGQLRARGCPRAYLLTARRTPAEAFYLLNGYRPAGRTAVLAADL